MTYIGIDPSLTHTGLIVLDRDGELRGHQTIEPKTTGPERLLYIEDCILKAINMIEPQLVVMEGYSYASVTNLPALGELGGVLKRLFYLERIPLKIVAPMALKKWITGSGKGDKNKVMLEAYKKYRKRGVDLADEHQYDAYGLADIAHAIGTKRTDLMQYEKEVLAKIKQPPASSS